MTVQVEAEEGGVGSGMCLNLPEAFSSFALPFNRPQTDVIPLPPCITPI